MKRIITSLFALITSLTYAQDSNILMGLSSPALGVKIKNNFPTGTGGFARAFSLSNQDASLDFFSFGVNGTYNNGVSTMNYGFIGQSYTNIFMSFKPDGNIGIGTTSPTEKLSVKGKIRAQEIKVETANWPDYVFAEDYQLPSLQQTEKHIKQKGHLPGIPSAAEVKANGVDLGAMNAKLLQKMEEMTLIMIQLNKKVEQQAETLKMQQKQLDNLK
ncbi:hypothetical protein CPT03_16985 [Pedobacter ginsengisoli]|uniref:Peptidase S74 domain-containing protein n=1 Tax=Pedobacter ginsengisoli TaxID=363852 RepID=A0A2D1U8Y4_9SPHI|nr:hypothetical protein [Pedobacter ginsengisoli]ATP58040.1 hypothetical protein CPT03_16985 [Pedobacter ginsengisoli]